MGDLLTKNFSQKIDIQSSIFMNNNHIIIHKCFTGLVIT